jgi:hypothetical protein
MATSQSETEVDRKAEQAQRQKGELEALQSEEKEIAILIRQTEGEVERNTARRDQAAVRVREMEANIEQYARQEIGPIYAAAQAAELRVYVMKAQLELLQARMPGAAQGDPARASPPAGCAGATTRLWGRAERDCFGHRGHQVRHHEHHPCPGGRA